MVKNVQKWYIVTFQNQNFRMLLFSGTPCKHFDVCRWKWGAPPRTPPASGQAGPSGGRALYHATRAFRSESILQPFSLSSSSSSSLLTLLLSSYTCSGAEAKRTTGWCRLWCIRRWGGEGLQWRGMPSRLQVGPIVIIAIAIVFNIVIIELKQYFCRWGPWGTWDPCSVTCGQGRQK